MVLVDTSVWVSHFHHRNSQLVDLLLNEEVHSHPFVIGELACEQLKNRREIFTLLDTLPKAQIAEDEEILKFIEYHHLMGIGLGLIDVHLLASSLLTHIPLWSFDKTLKTISNKLKICFEPEPV